jgi:NADH:ubiquinone oxidoreductase subunit 5 (subunit L)/multisubunit Na+/H+ antiporter MnhA subunit
MGYLLLWLPLIYILPAIALAVFPRLPRKGSPLMVAAAAFGFLVALVFMKTALDGSSQMPVQASASWFDLPYFETVISIHADGFSAAMIFAAALAALLVSVFALGENTHPYTPSYPAILLFAGAVTGTLLADSLIEIFVFWQLQTLAIYLSGTDREDPCRSAGARQNLFYCVAADLILLAAVLYAVAGLGTARISQLLDHVPPSKGVFPFCALLTAAVFIKAGQFPFSRHLAAAARRAGPAFGAFASACGIAAACYLPVRLYPVFAQNADAHTLLSAWAAISAVLCATGAMGADDIFSAATLVIAANAAMAMCCVGMGLFASGAFHIFNTLLTGLLLLLCAGTLVQAAASPLFSRMSGMKYSMPVTQFFFIICALALCGIPPLCGFYSLSRAIAGADAAEHAVYPVLLFMTALCASSAVLTGAKAFGGDAVVMPDRNYRTPGTMLAPIILLATLIVFSGWTLDHDQIFSKLVTPAYLPQQEDLPLLPIAVPYAIAVALGAVTPLVLFTHRNGNFAIRLQRAFAPLAGLAGNGFGEAWLARLAGPVAALSGDAAQLFERGIQSAARWTRTSAQTTPGLIAQASGRAAQTAGRMTAAIFGGALRAAERAYGEDSLPALAAAMAAIAAITAYMIFQ